MIKPSFFKRHANVNCFIILFFLFSFTGVYGQEKVVSLKNFLSVLEERFQVSFTYADENVEGKVIEQPPASQTLEEALNYLQEKTNLSFKRLNTRFITITEKDYIKYCGYIIDASTNEELPGVVISLGDDFAVTNENGFFEFKSSSKDTALMVKSVGYENTRWPLKLYRSNECPKISIKPKLITLRQVVVNNLLTQGINKRIDGRITIDTDDLGILPGLIEPDVLQTVQALPGIQSIDERVSDINVRGGTNDQNLVMWNGIKMYQTGHFFGLISAFNPYLTDNVSLIKNGTSAYYGDGVSGTLLLETDNNVVKEFSGSAGVNFISGDVYSKIPVSKNSSLQLSARRAYTDQLLTPTYKEYFGRVFLNTEIVSSIDQLNEIFGTNEDFYFFDASLKYLHDFSESSKLRVSFLAIDNDLEYQENAIVDNVVKSRTSTLGQQNIASGISFSQLWNDDLKMNINLKMSSYKLGAVNFDILKGQRLEQSNEVLDLGANIDFRKYITDNFDVFAGYQLSEIGVTNFEDVNNPDFSRLIKEVMLTHTGFLEGGYTSKNQSTFINIGLRGNYYEKVNRFTVEPRLSINQRLFDNFYFEILGEQKSQSTTQVIDFQNDFLGVEKRRWILSNGDDVPLIQSTQISAGINYNKKDLLVSIEGYYKEIEGITTSSQGFLNQFQFIRESGVFRSTGFEALINRKFNRINIWSGYTYSENTFRFPDLIPSEFPANLDIRHILTFGSSYKTDNLEFSAGLTWHSGIPYTPAIAVEGTTINSIVYDEPNSAVLENYFRLDASIKYHFVIKKGLNAQLGASLWNITDHQNTVSQYYSVGSESQLKQLNELALGLTPNMMLRVNF